MKDKMEPGEGLNLAVFLGLLLWLAIISIAYFVFTRTPEEAAMRVSVTLHTDEPDQDANQRQYEARYRNFNRQYADLAIDPKTGDGTCQFDGLLFPEVGDAGEVLTFFSIGVCIAPADQGGAIIIAGPVNPVIDAYRGRKPLLSAAIAVRASRLAAMRADGRLVDDVAPDPKRGLNL